MTRHVARAHREYDSARKLKHSNERINVCPDLSRAGWSVRICERSCACRAWWPPVTGGTVTSTSGTQCRQLVISSASAKDAAMWHKGKGPAQQRGHACSTGCRHGAVHRPRHLDCYKFEYKRCCYAFSPCSQATATRVIHAAVICKPRRAQYTCCLRTRGARGPTSKLADFD
jgi:hypothetical protein